MPYTIGGPAPVSNDDEPMSEIAGALVGLNAPNQGSYSTWTAEVTKVLAPYLIIFLKLASTMSHSI